MRAYAVDDTLAAVVEPALLAADAESRRERRATWDATARPNPATQRSCQCQGMVSGRQKVLTHKGGQVHGQGKDVISNKSSMQLQGLTNAKDYGIAPASYCSAMPATFSL